MKPSSSFRLQFGGDFLACNKTLATSFRKPSFRFCSVATSTPQQPVPSPTPHPAPPYSPTVSRPNLKPPNPLAPHSFHLISEAIHEGNLKHAEALYNAMGAPKTLSEYSVAINLHGKLRKVAEARELYDRMLKEGFQPDNYTFVAILGAYFKGGRQEEGFALFKELQQHGETVRNPLNCHVYNEVLFFYTSTSQYEAELTFFDAMVQHGPYPNLASFHILLRMIGHKQDAKAAKTLLAQMRAAKITPNLKIYTLLLSLFAKTAHYAEAKQLHQEMKAGGMDAELYREFFRLLFLCSILSVFIKFIFPVTIFSIFLTPRR
jgi:pentatricopeptide repeat protein